MSINACRLFAIASAFAFVGCSPAPNAPSSTPVNSATTSSSVAFPASDVFMTVNGEAVDRALVLAYAKQRNFDVNDPTQLKAAADKLAEFVAIVQAGNADPFAKSAEFAVDQLKSSAGMVVERFATQPVLTDAEVEAGYQAQISAAGGVQLNLQHILLSDAPAAQTVQAALAAGKSFADVMQEMHGSSGVRETKDWGWTTAISLPEPLRAPALALKNGGFTANPIALGETYYFVNVLASRPFEAPEFELVKEGMRKAMEQNRAQEAIAKIKAQAKIELR